MQVISIDPHRPDGEAIRAAARQLISGGLVVFPTETVYGLAADAMHPVARARLYDIKQRPSHQPLTYHLASVDQVEQMLGGLPPVAEVWTKRYWPGPLTLLLSDGDGGKVGFRVPSDSVAQQFLSACGVPVAATSANRSGEPPPTTAAQVLASFAEGLDVVLDAGPTSCGGESTIVDLSGDQPVLIRRGVIDVSESIAHG